MNIKYNTPKNVKLSDIFDEEPKVVYINDVNEDGYKKLIDDFNDCHKIGQSIIPVVIDSFGGSVYSCFGMMDIIKNSDIPVATILQSKAMSAGSLLFSSGHDNHRYMSPNATIMIHDASSLTYGKVEEIKSDSAEVERVNVRLYEMLAENCGQEKDFFKKKVHEKGHSDWWIDSTEALELGLAKKIGIPSFEVNLEINYNLKLNERTNR